jgi:5'-deoxynucleotidase YfbR-like HD superfamily hydrolase
MDTRTNGKPQRDANLEDVLERLKGGHILRYHTRPDCGDGQNVAAHTWRAMVILQTLWPDLSKNALLHLMYHDIAESRTGDIPATTKWDYDRLAVEVAKIEFKYNCELGVNFPVTDKEKDCCDIADKLELVFHCQRMYLRGNYLAGDIIVNGRDYLDHKYRGRPHYDIAKNVLIELLDNDLNPSE